MAIQNKGFLTSPAVSVVTGSNTIEVTGSVDCSYTVSGTAVILDGGSYFIEAISGTAANPSGISTITLRDPFDGPTLTDVPMTVFNTTEGLRDAIRRARDIAVSSAEIQSVFGEVLLSTDETITVTINGVEQTLTPYGYLSVQVQDLIEQAQGGVDALQALQEAVATLQTTVDTIQGDLDNLVIEATTQADRATTQATAAANSATAASTSANNAANSETAAKTSEDNSKISETNAATSETNAANSETAASNSATAAATSANSAATSESNAANSETAAATSANSAATSESNAATSATNSENSSLLSKKWAVELEDVTVDGSEYSSKHYSIKSRKFSETSKEYSDISLSVSNFKGRWISLTGPLEIPASVEYQDTIYMLMEDIPDVTLSEPTPSNTDWGVVGTISSSSPDSERLGGELPEFYAKATDVEQATISKKGTVEKATQDEMNNGSTDKYPDAMTMKTFTDANYINKSGNSILEGSLEVSNDVIVNSEIFVQRNTLNGTRLRITSDGGRTYLQTYNKDDNQESRGIRFGGYGGRDLGSFELYYNGGVENIYHSGNFSPAANLTTNDNSLPLAASQGTILKELVDGVSISTYYSVGDLTIDLSTARKHRVIRYGTTDATITITGTGQAGTEVLINNIRDDSGVVTIVAPRIYTGVGSSSGTTHTLTGQAELTMIVYVTGVNLMVTSVV